MASVSIFSRTGHRPLGVAREQERADSAAFCEFSLPGGCIMHIAFVVSQQRSFP